jgi:hypothetical protein
METDTGNHNGEGALHGSGVMKKVLNAAACKCTSSINIAIFYIGT